MGNPREPLEPGTTYHIFNHSVGKDKLFREKKNYAFFMGKFCQWIVPVCDVLAYNLLPNHFHLVVRIKSYQELEEFFGDKIYQRIERMMLKNQQLALAQTPEHNVSDNPSNIRMKIIEKLVIEQFANCFNAYAQAYNKVYVRMGSLLKESFQRKKIESEEYLIQVICYVHNNAVNHGLVEKRKQWKHSSYDTILGNEETFVCRDEVLGYFETRKNFVFVHDLFLISGPATPTGSGNPDGVAAAGG